MKEQLVCVQEGNTQRRSSLKLAMSASQNGSSNVTPSLHPFDFPSPFHHERRVLPNQTCLKEQKASFRIRSTSGSSVSLSVGCCVQGEVPEG